VAQGVHQPDQVVGKRSGVVTVFGLTGESDAALVHGDDLEVPGQVGMTRRQ
jgi:hypothetical protein